MHVCNTWNFSAISRVVLWRSESIIALIRSSSISTGRPERFSSLKNHQNEICQTNFDTAVLLRLRRHKQLFVSLRCVFPFVEIKKQNMTIMFLLIFHFSTNTKRKLRNQTKNFFYWLTADCQLSNNKMCFTFGLRHQT